MAQTAISDRAKVEVFVFLLTPGLSMMSLASAIEPLRALNRLLGRDAYRWRMASLTGDDIDPSNGLTLRTLALDEALKGAHRLFVVAGIGVNDVSARPYLAALRKAARSGVAIGSVSTGAYLLARAGLIGARRFTLHWESRSAFMEEFPDLKCTNRLYEIDGGLMTSSGGAAAMDMMLHVIGETHGGELADAVANQFHHERIRGQRDMQRGGSLTFLSPAPAQLQKAVALMRASVEQPRSLPDIAGRSGLSPRQLERLALKHLGMSPSRLYMQFRLERGRELLTYSNISITDVAVQVGFASVSHFATWFKRAYGLRPTQARGEAFGAAPREETPRELS